MKRVFLWVVCVFVAYRLVGCLADHMMGCRGTARAETFITKAWYLEESRDALMFAWGDEWRLEISFESTKRRDRGGEKEGEHQKLGFSLALNRMFFWNTGSAESEWSPVFGFGVGLGLLYDFQWQTERYEVVVAEVDYPSFETDSSFFVQIVGTVEVGPGVVTLHLRARDEVDFDALLGVGVGW